MSLNNTPKTDCFVLIRTINFDPIDCGPFVINTNVLQGEKKEEKKSKGKFGRLIKYHTKRKTGDQQ